MNGKVNQNMTSAIVNGPAKLALAVALALWSCAGYGQQTWQRGHLSYICSGGQAQGFNVTVYGQRTMELKIAVYVPLDSAPGKYWGAAPFPSKGMSFATLCDSERGLCLPMSGGRMRISERDKDGARRVGFEFDNGQESAMGAVVLKSADADQLPKGCG